MRIKASCLSVLFLVAACGKDNANPPEKIEALSKATDAYCACVSDQLKKPASEIQPTACDEPRKVWNDLSKAMDVPAGKDSKFDALRQAWTACSRQLSSVGKP